MFKLSFVAQELETLRVLLVSYNVLAQMPLDLLGFLQQYVPSSSNRARASLISPTLHSKVARNTHATNKPTRGT